MNRKPPPRVYLPDEVPAHGVVSLPPEQSHHIGHVLRLAEGDSVTGFDGLGNQYDATISRISKHSVTLNVGEAQAVTRESPLRVELAQGISSGERMDYTIQKAVELGVSAIQPITTERTVVRLASERAAKRVAHWRGIAIAACEQCGRNYVPEVKPVVTLPVWLGSLGSGAMRLTLTPGAAIRLAELPAPEGPIILLAGPEGGLSPREREDVGASGFTSVRLGPRVLRTETAALAALSAMQVLWGDF